MENDIEQQNRKVALEWVLFEAAIGLDMFSMEDWDAYLAIEERFRQTGDLDEKDLRRVIETWVKCYAAWDEWERKYPREGA